MTSSGRPIDSSGRYLRAESVHTVTLQRQVGSARECASSQIGQLMGRPQNSRLVGQALKHLPSRLARPFIDGELIEERHGSESGQETGPGEAEFEDFHRQHRIANPDFVPWHRIISSSGVISPRGNSASLERQAVMLRAEGVVVRNAAGPADEPGYGPDAFGLAAACSVKGAIVTCYQEGDCSSTSGATASTSLLALPEGPTRSTT
ncbi:hypothetical protein E5Q_02098 [Mixia osmundae IAM 14324]|uniref:Uncharacterized protein n=1 Tax=Mixia osmundae (strain CBS 9802 / IAM 14324 / JCM 22182 / KY 12970) TaxID=764103 RepID=G7DXY4_MIXOS|nr:hypothetical protein E5Q_02098 [Mixia osmundae IAM 14324]